MEKRTSFVEAIMEAVDPIFLELGVIIAAAAVFGVLARVFNQPTILGYLLAGVVLGPLGAALIQNQENIDALSKVGIALLLFLVGLEMDWQKIRRLGRITGLLALVQIVLTFLISLAAAVALGFSLVSAAIISLALTFSSTVIVVKLLSERHDIDSLFGRISIGVLLIQDIVAIFVLAIIPGLANLGSLSIDDALTLLVAKTVALIVTAWLFSTKIFPRIFKSLANSQELLFIVSLAWCFIFAITTVKVGFSVEVGALLAGVSLASLPYAIDIVGRIRSLRDFFIILFFVFLGMQINFSAGVAWWPVVVFSIIVLFIKPLISIIGLGALGLRRRVAFLSGLSLGQMSEFSLILAGLAVNLNLISPDELSLVTVLTTISLFFSPYLINVSDQLFARLQSALVIFERKDSQKYSLSLVDNQLLSDHIVIFGYHRMGYHILKTLHNLNHKVIVIDFNPEVIDHLQKVKIPAIFGDAQDEELLRSIHLAQAKMVISTIPHKEENMFLLQKLKKFHREVITIFTARTIDDALEFYKNGADYVILPYQLSGEYVSELLRRYEERTLKKYLEGRREEVRLLKAKRHAFYVE